VLAQKTAWLGGIEAVGIARALHAAPLFEVARGLFAAAVASREALDAGAGAHVADWSITAGAIVVARAADDTLTLADVADAARVAMGIAQALDALGVEPVAHWLTRRTIGVGSALRAIAVDAQRAIGVGTVRILEALDAAAVRGTK
jgi:hypothetical protein